MSTGPTGYQGPIGDAGVKGLQGAVGAPGYGYNLDARSISFYGSSTGPTGTIGNFSATTDVYEVFDFSNATVGVLYTSTLRSTNITVTDTRSVKTAGQHYSFMNMNSGTNNLNCASNINIDAYNNSSNTTFTFPIPAKTFLRLIWDGNQFWSFRK